MRFALARPLAILVSLALLGVVGLVFHELAGLRANAVAQGPTVQATARYQAPDAGGSILAPGSDPDLRVVVDGDLATAKHVAVLVPGMGHTPLEFDHPEQFAQGYKTKLPYQSRNLREASSDPDHLAVVAWLGYRPPDPLRALTGQAIAPGAANLAALEQYLSKAAPGANVTWLCHSYGSLICGSALKRVSPTAVVLLGSPGIQTDTAAGLGGSAKIYAIRGDSDAIVWTELMDFTGGGFGEDPSDGPFGAHRLPCAPGSGHSDYYRTGSPQLAALAQVVEGKNPPTG